MNEQKNISPIGITMGCPVGIGPEIILDFFTRQAFNTQFQPVVLGDIGVLRHTAAILSKNIEIVRYHPGGTIVSGTIPVCELSTLDVKSLCWGKPDKETGRAMADYIREAVKMIRLGELDAMVTCPITKAALNKAGFHYPGHTEMLADLTGSQNFRMMMAGTRLKVVLVTIHEPLRRVPELLTTVEILACIRQTVSSLKQDFGIKEPRIGVAGLNPHCGEQGMFGREDIEIIAPAIEQFRGQLRISGPIPPDTVFYRAASGEFDAVVAMYHDQGLIPFKLLHFSDGVNVTLGLPIVRTSVDHGTAYDIAGKGKADSASLVAAWNLAALIVDNRRQERETP